jgi:hypothetical protein
MISAAVHNEMVEFIIRLRDDCRDFETFSKRLPDDVAMAFPEATADDARKVLEDILARDDEERGLC